MGQYLGGAPSGAVYVAVHNFGTVDIPRGRVVSMYPDADLVYGAETAVAGQGYGAGNAFKVPIRNWVATTQDIPFGVSLNPIPAGTSGTVCILGVTVVETDKGVTQGDKLQIATGGVADTFSAGKLFGKAISTDALWNSTLIGGSYDGPVASSAEYALVFVSFATLTMA